MRREKEIEASVCKHAEDLGMLQYKFSPEHDKGMPDRLFFHRHRAWFIEVKDPNGAVSPTQAQRMRELSPHVPVYVIEDVPSGKALLEKIAQGTWS